MAINLITAPSAVPAAVADYEQQNALIAALALAAQGAARVVGSNIVKGAVFLVGGSVYLAATDTAISGAASDYVKLTITGTTLVPSYVADLTGVTWSSTWNGYYDAGGNLYEFDELKAIFAAQIAVASLRNIGVAALAAGWALALTDPGAEWTDYLKYDANFHDSSGSLAGLLTVTAGTKYFYLSRPMTVTFYAGSQGGKLFSRYYRQTGNPEVIELASADEKCATLLPGHYGITCTGGLCGIAAVSVMGADDFTGIVTEEE